MFKLMVSSNFGMNYSEEQVVDDISLLDEKCKKLDEQWLRWMVEDETGDIVRVCKIHSGILATFYSLEGEN